MKEIKILFVCTGNTCRSPMAEAYANYQYANDIKLRVRARSAGMYVTEDSINPNAAEALEHMGIKSVIPHDYQNHVPHQICERDIAESDLVVCMSMPASDMLANAFPQYADRITAFEHSISDPYGQSEAAYESCLFEITCEIDYMIDIIKEDIDEI